MPVRGRAPARPDPGGFRWLLASSWITNIGDGMMLAAGPLLVASQTSDAFLVAMASLLQRLPWLLFGLHAGVVADRFDRQRIVVGVNLLRAGVLAVLTTSIAVDAVNIAVVLVAMFLLGVAEVFVDVAGQALLPGVVEPERLGVATSRLVAGDITGNQLAGPPIGAALFVVGMFVPFAAQSVLVAAGALLMLRIRLLTAAGPRSTARPRDDIVEGVRWLWSNAPVRTLTITIVVFNVTFGAAFSILVLYSSERLGLGELGFGVLTAAGALGGLAGSAAYPALERRVSLSTLLRVGLIVETLTHLGLALTVTPWVAIAILVAFGGHTSIWGTLSTSLRLRATPDHLQGRVGSVYKIAVHGGIVVGAAFGGVIASAVSIVAVYWFAFAGSAALVVFIWRPLIHLDPDR